MFSAKEPTVSIDWAFPVPEPDLSTFLEPDSKPRRPELSVLCREADAVMYVRVTATSPRAALRPNFFDVQARVLEVAKGQQSESITFRQPRWRDEPTPYKVGTQVVLFLHSRDSGTFDRLYGPHIAFAVVDGVVQGSNLYPDYRGMNVKKFLEKVRDLVGRGAAGR